MKAESRAGECRQLKRRLGRAGDQHADGQSENLLVQVRAHAGCQKQDRRDHDQIEDHGAGGRNKKMAAGIEHSHEDGGEADHQHVGEHHAQQQQHQVRVRLKVMHGQDQGNSEHHQGDDGCGRHYHR